MKTKSTMVQISVVIEESAEDEPGDLPCSDHNALQSSVVAAIESLLSERPNSRVEFYGYCQTPLEDRHEYGRCEVCQRWVYDLGSNRTVRFPGVQRGAKVEGRFRCDEHLPPGHPLCFCGIGYNGPVSD